MKLYITKQEIITHFNLPVNTEIEVEGSQSTATSNKSWATIIDTPDKKTSELLAECKSLFPVWLYYSDEDLDTYCPAPTTTITKVYKESIEPDMLNMSYDDGISQGITFMSARERIILELQYFKETGKHLDIVGWTITSTLDRNGCAMHMCGNTDGRFLVSSLNRSYRNTEYGLRKQIS